MTIFFIFLFFSYGRKMPGFRPWPLKGKKSSLTIRKPCIYMNNGNQTRDRYGCRPKSVSAGLSSAVAYGERRPCLWRTAPLRRNMRRYELLMDTVQYSYTCKGKARIVKQTDCNRESSLETIKHQDMQKSDIIQALFFLSQSTLATSIVTV